MSRLIINIKSHIRLHPIMYGFCILLIGMCFISVHINSKPIPPEQFRKTPLIIAGDKTFPPFEYLDDRGFPIGFNVELTKEIMNRLGITNYKIILNDWDDIINDYQKGKIDLIMGMMYTKERAEKYNFGPSHGSVYQDIIYRKGTSPIKSLSELSGKKILVERSSINSDILIENGFKEDLLPQDNAIVALKMLSEGKGDAV